MPLSYVLDENLRGVLWRAVQRHNLRKIYPIGCNYWIALTTTPLTTV